MLHERVHVQGSVAHHRYEEQFVGTVIDVLWTVNVCDPAAKQVRAEAELIAQRDCRRSVRVCCARISPSLRPTAVVRPRTPSARKTSATRATFRFQRRTSASSLLSGRHPSPPRVIKCESSVRARSQRRSILDPTFGRHDGGPLPGSDAQASHSSHLERGEALPHAIRTGAGRRFCSPTSHTSSCGRAGTAVAARAEPHAPPGAARQAWRAASARDRVTCSLRAAGNGPTPRQGTLPARHGPSADIRRSPPLDRGLVESLQSLQALAS